MTSRNNIDRGGREGEKRRGSVSINQPSPKPVLNRVITSVSLVGKGQKGPSAMDFDPGHRLIRNYTFHRAMIITLTRITNGPRFRASGGSTRFSVDFLPARGGSATPSASRISKGLWEDRST